MGLGTSTECFWKIWVGIHMDKDFCRELIYGYGEEVGRSMVYGILRTDIYLYFYEEVSWNLSNQVCSTEESDNMKDVHNSQVKAKDFFLDALMLLI